MRTQLTRTAQVGALCALFLAVAVVPGGSTVTYSWGFGIFPEPLKFRVTCHAHAESGSISGLKCKGYWLSGYTSECGPMGEGPNLSCQTSYKSVNCPEGGGNFPMIAYAWNVSGDSPSSSQYTTYAECSDEDNN